MAAQIELDIMQYLLRLKISKIGKSCHFCLESIINVLYKYSLYEFAYQLLYIASALFVQLDPLVLTTSLLFILASKFILSISFVLIGFIMPLCNHNFYNH
jgi:hypothetical protein